MAKLKWKKSPKKMMKEIVRAMQKTLPSVLSSAILGDLDKGVSPVKNKRMKKYSDSYKKVIKKGKGPYQDKDKGTPNLKLTGDMHNSLEITKRDKGIKIKFKDKKANWHNTGNDKLPRRPLLPTENKEKFNDRISKRSLTLLERVSAAIFNKS